MPPKKKKGEGKKGKKSAKPTVAAIPLPDPLPVASREYYLTQIRDLEHRLERYQRKCDELSVMNGEFKAEYNQLTTDKKEIVSFLKKSLENRGEEIADLNDRLIGLQQAKDNDKEHFETTLQQLRTEFQETKDQLTSENMILGGKLAALEEFKIQREDYVLQMATLREQIAQQEADHKEEIYRLERKQVVDKDRLKKDMVMRVNQVAAEFRKVSNKQMAETTKRTIRENVSINAQLAKMSDKTMELIQENDELRGKEKQQKQHIDMLEVNEKELAKKNISNLKIIRMMTEKAKSQDVLLGDYEDQEQQYQVMMIEAEDYRNDLVGTRTNVERLEDDVKQQDQSLKDAAKIVQSEKKIAHKLKKVLADAADAIKTALKRTSTEDVEESPYDVIEKRDNMLENLLVLLNSAVIIGVGPPPAEFGTSSSDVRLISPPRMPGTASGLREGDLPTPLMKGPSVAHYQLGDLGIVPKPDQYIPTYFEKMRDATAVQQLGSLKKVLTRSVGVQTISTQKAVFYADQLLSRFPNSANLIHKIDSRTTIGKKVAT